MSYSHRALESSLRGLRSTRNVPGVTLTRGIPAARRRFQSSCRTRPETPQKPLVKFQPGTRFSHSGVARERHGSSDDFDGQKSFGLRNNSSNSHFADHLDKILPPITFPPEMARRILTHASHNAAMHGHNARFSFIGRRAMEAYLLLFLHSSPAAQKDECDYDQMVATTLNTYLLGEHVAPRWNLGRVIRWVPTVSANYVSKKKDESEIAGAGGFGEGILKSVGLYKVQGEVVQAVVGGIYHQYGASVANRLFHTRILPQILLPGRPQGLHDSFHEDALQICAHMGGPESNLLEPVPRRPESSPVETNP